MTHPLLKLLAFILSRSSAALFFIVSVSIAHASPPQLKFQHIFENEDIVTGEVRTIYQDSQGFMWIGGWRGLWRYDGYEFDEIKVSVNDNGATRLDAIPNVTDVVEDQYQNLWITTTYAILKYNPKTNTVKRLEDDASQAIQSSSSFAHRIVKLDNGKLLAAVSSAQNGLLLIDPATERYEAITTNSEDSNDPKRPSNGILNGVYTSKSGTTWIAHSRGIDKYDIETKTFIYYPIKPDEPAWVRDLAEDDQGWLWLATNQGVYHYNPKTAQYKHYSHETNNPTSLGSNDIWRITTDSKGMIWASADQGGLNLYDENIDNFINYSSVPGDTSTLGSSIVRIVFEDNTGDLWVGMYPQGVDFFDRSSAAITTYKSNPDNLNSLSHNSILGIEEDQQGNLWIATDGGGLNYFDRTNGTFTRYLSDPDDPATIASNAVLSLLIDSENVLWMGHWGGGLSKMNLNNKEITRIGSYPQDRAIDSSDKINSPHVWRIFEDSDNTLWFATHSGGLNKYDRKTQTFRHYQQNENTAHSIQSNWVWSIYEDSKNNFWVGTTQGLHLFDRDKETFRTFSHDPNDPTTISNPVIYDITETAAGQLWFATSSGADLFDYETETFTHVSKAHGLFNNSVRTIIPGPNGLLWLGTAGGTSTYDPATQKVKNLNRDGGKLVGTINFNASLISKRGEVVLGGVNGLRIYQPNKLLGNTAVPPIVFTELLVNTDNIKPGGKDKLLEQHINYTKELVLDYTKSMFVISFSALNYRNSGKNQYRYKLKGFDKEWINIGTQRSAKYTNLDAGKYVFHIQGSNNDGIWNTTGKTLTIIQLPPPWKTWWAYTLYVLFALSLVAWAIQHQRNKRRFVEQQNRLLEIKVTERTAELASKNKDIQQMLSNMRQGLFTIMEDCTIHHEYSQYLESIFETSDISGKHFTDLLIGNSNLGQDIKDRLINSVTVIIGDDICNYDFNCNQLIEEYQIELNGKPKILSLDWNPILEDDLICKLMVSVRDVTQLKLAESEARAKARELEIISQILNIPGDKFQSFTKSNSKLITKALSLTEGLDTLEKESIEAIFRYMHTLKGNSRTYGFTLLSNAAHEAESNITKIMQDTNGVQDITQLTHDLQHTRNMMDEYTNIYQNIVRQVNTQNSLLIKTQDSANDTEHQSNQPLDYSDQTDGYYPLSLVIGDIIESLPSIAEQLDKPVPNIAFNSSNIIFHMDAHELLQNCFSHILRNSMDHGIESADQRTNKGKSSAGNISIRCELYRDNVDIVTEDDGQGLNIKKLYEIGIERGLWESGSLPGIETITDLVFASGASTKDEVSTVSGRGVGMDAVKSFLLEEGGNISIEILEPEINYTGFNQFKLIISLPKRFYSLKNKSAA